MADVNANININIDSSSALSNLRNLETRINQFQRTVASSNASAAASQAELNRKLLDGINNTGLFSARQVDAIDSMARFSNALEKNKLTLSEYSRFAASQLPGMSRVFRREFDTMEQVATSRVKAMNTQYVALGRTVDGVTRAIAATPTGLSDGIATSAAMASQKQMIFNKLIDDGSTKLLNWGKNTQWAGRQLMVGLTLPLGAMAAAASAAFMEIDKASTSLKRVYGDLSTTTAEIDNNLQAIKALGSEYTKYGIAVSDTIQIAARAAATGATNEELMAATEQTLRFATLGQIDYNQALDTTISLQTAFGVSNDELSSKIDFLNAVENQTILTIEDMSLAIPRVATVVKGLGGDVEDLAIMMTAMREGGVSAENAANGLKSGLASMINPTKQANEYLSKFGINLRGIVEVNKGNLIGTVQQFGEELNKLSDLDRQRALEKTFGKYQFARMSALFDNMTKKSGQAARAMDLAGMSMEDLASIADNELGKISESTTVKFQAALEKLKLTIAPIGEAFLKLATPVVNLVTKLAEGFNSLPDPIKNAMGIATAAIAGLGPILLMGIGLMGNLVANIIKGVQWWRKLGARIRGDASAFSYMSKAEYEAMAATEALEGSTQSLTGKLHLQKGAVAALTAEYQRFAGVAGIAAGAMGAFPGKGGSAGKAPRRMARGGVVPGSGSGDKIPALLEPGETVITKKASQKYGSVISAMNAGTLPGFINGLDDNSADYSGIFDIEGNEISKDLVNAHGHDKTVLSQKQLQDFKKEYVKDSQANKKTPNQEVLRAERGAFLSNLVFPTPGEFNEQKMSGTQSSELFNNKDPKRKKVFENSMHGMYVSVAEQMGVDVEDVLKNPSLKKDIDSFGSSIGKGLRSLGDEIATDPRFYAVVDDALRTAPMKDENTRKMLMATRENPTMFEGRRKTTEEERKQNPKELSRKGRVVLSPEMQGGQVYQKPYKYRKLPFSKKINVGSQGIQISKQSEKNGEIDINGYNKGKRKMANPEANDPNILTRSQKRNSPHPQSSIDGTDDQRAYDNARQAEAKRNWKKSQSAQRQEIGQIDRIPARRRELMAESIRSASIGGGDRRQAIKSAKLAAQSRTDEEILGIIKQEDNERIAQSKKASAERKAARAASDKRLAAQERANQQQIERQVSSSNISENAIAANETRREEEARRGRRGGSIGRRVSRGIRGGGGALGMASMVPFMAQNEQGQFMGMNANTLGMGMMGASMASQILPSIIPLLANPVGAAAAAIAAAGAGFWFLNSQTNNLAENGKKLSDAMYGSTKNFEEMAAFFDKKTWKDRLSNTVSKKAGSTATEQDLSEAKSFVQSDAGANLVEGLKLAQQTYGREGAVEALKNNLQRMLLEGIIDPSTANALATELGNQLGDMQIGINAIANINSVVGPNGEKLNTLKERLQILADINGDTTNLQDSFSRAGLQWDGASWWTQMTMIVKGEGTADLFATNAVADVTNKMQAYQTEIDRVNVMFESGKLSAKQYQDRISTIFDASKVVNWSNTVKESQKLFGDQFKEGETAFNNLADNFAESMKNALQSSIGQEKLDKFISGLDVTVGAEIGNEQTFNLLNADRVASMVDALRGAGKENEALQLLEKQKAAMEFAVKVSSPNFPIEALGKMVENGTASFDIITNMSVKYDSADAQAISSIAQGMLDPKSHLNLMITTALDNDRVDAAGEWLQKALELKEIGVDIGINLTRSDVIALDEALKDVHAFQEVPRIMTKKAFIQYEEDGYELTDAQMKAFLAMPEDEQKTFYSIYRTLIAEPEKVGAVGAQSLSKYSSQYVNSTDMLVSGRKHLLDDAAGLTPKGKKTPKVPLVADDKKGGGDTKSWLQQLIDDTQANMQIFPAMINKMKGKGVPDQIIEMVGAGEDGLKRAKEILGLSREKLNKLISDYAKTSVSQAINNTQAKINAARQKKKAEGILTGQGFSKEDAQTISANTEDVLAIINANSGKSKKSIAELVAKYRELIAVTKTEEELYSESLDKFNKLRKMMEAGFDAAEEAKRVEFANQFKNANGKTVEEMEKQVSLNQRMIDAQQKIVDNKQEEINDYQRTNDLIQQGVEDLQRQDELRNRISSALSHELELMSNAENKIKAAYDQRIEALDKVQKINEDIANQQRQQLSLAQALSTGDVYAAAAAAQEMQSSQAQSASDRLRSDLQQGMQNQVDSLRTADGLTRAQAEEQINAIKEQSYQTSLLIRAEEDKIYQNNLEVRRLTNEIYDINENNIEPLQKQNDAYSQKLSYQQEDLENAIKGLTLAGLTRQQYEDQANALQDAIDNAKDLTPELVKLAGDYHAIYEEAKRAANETQRLGKSISNPGKPSETKQEVVSDVMANLKKTGGGMGLFFSTGGTVPKKFATGGHVGMDSVPAMLTPGEFVVRKSMVGKYGSAMFNSINQGSFSLPKYNMNSVGSSTMKPVSVNNNVTPVYNNTYSINVPVNQPGASADEIAYKVMTKIQNMDNASIRRINGY